MVHRAVAHRAVTAEEPRDFQNLVHEINLEKFAHDKGPLLLELLEIRLTNFEHRVMLDSDIYLDALGQSVQRDHAETERWVYVRDLLI